ncbi:hypothetical protein Tco_1116757 [Tanacetum coccineum]
MGVHGRPPRGRVGGRWGGEGGGDRGRKELLRGMELLLERGRSRGLVVRRWLGCEGCGGGDDTDSGQLELHRLDESSSCLRGLKK